VRPARLERATFCFVGKRSIRLSYGRILLLMSFNCCSQSPIIADGFKECQT
jgi:hypothetical protein